MILNFQIKTETICQRQNSGDQVYIREDSIESHARFYNGGIKWDCWVSGASEVIILSLAPPVTSPGPEMRDIKTRRKVTRISRETVAEWWGVGCKLSEAVLVLLLVFGVITSAQVTKISQILNISSRRFNTFKITSTTYWLIVSFYKYSQYSVQVKKSENTLDL